MRIQFVSDLHLEYPANYNYLKANPIRVNGDILVIAGDLFPLKDIVRFREVLDFFSKRYDQVFWVPGNHEYYGSDISIFAKSFDIPILKNVRLVNNKVMVLGNLEWVFSTLWSEIPLSSSDFISNHMPDFKFIRNKNGLFDVKAYNAFHKLSLAFLTGALSQFSWRKRIVVTHHLPTFKNYPKQYENSSLNAAFATELSTLIEKSGPDYWIFGHHHQATLPFKFGKTVLLNNQLGYVDNLEHTSFKSIALNGERDDDVVEV